MEKTVFAQATSGNAFPKLIICSTLFFLAAFSSWGADITVTPAVVTVSAGGSVQFSADEAVVWGVEAAAGGPAAGDPAGGVDAGSIDTAGLYTAPVVLPAAITIDAPEAV